MEERIHLDLSRRDAEVLLHAAFVGRIVLEDPFLSVVLSQRGGDAGRAAIKLMTIGGDHTSTLLIQDDPGVDVWTIKFAHALHLLRKSIGTLMTLVYPKNPDVVTAFSEGRFG